MTRGLKEKKVFDVMKVQISCLLFLLQVFNFHIRTRGVEDHFCQLTKIKDETKA